MSKKSSKSITFTIHNIRTVKSTVFKKNKNWFQQITGYQSTILDFSAIWCMVAKSMKFHFCLKPKSINQ